MEKIAQPPVQLYKCHAGTVADIATCPFGPYLASLGEDGRLYLYNYEERVMVFHYQFPAKGVALIWLPLTVQSPTKLLHPHTISFQVETSGDEIIMAFDDGNLRSVILSVHEESPPTFAYFQLIKPHCKPVSAMALSPDGALLVTGSIDMTIFVFQVQPQKDTFTKLVPIGLVRVPEVVSCLHWHPHRANTILVGCNRGHFSVIDVPSVPQDYTNITYELKVEVKEKRFKTYKAQIRRDIKIAEIEKRKAEKLEKKMEELERVKKENPGLEIDEEVFLEDSESEEELEPLHIPDPPNKILWMQVTPDDTIWLSMAGYDAGYIYEFKTEQTVETPFRFQMIHDADDIEISSYVYK